MTTNTNQERRAFAHQVRKNLDLPPPSFKWNLSATVPPNTTEDDDLRETRQLPGDVVVRRVFIVADAAAQNLVGARVGVVEEDQAWIPRDHPDDARFHPVNEHPIDEAPMVPLPAGTDVFVQYVSNEEVEDRFVKTELSIMELPR